MQEVERIYGTKGALEAFVKAKQQGKVRHIGFTGHHDPEVHLAMLNGFDGWETVQHPVNLIDPHYLSFVKNVLPKVDAAGLGKIAMKTAAMGLLKKNNVIPQKNWSYVWYNTWQPFDYIVENNPLAFIDWESLPLDDVIDYYYTGYGDDNLVAAPVYNPGHKLCYFPSMLINEVIIIKQLDSRPGCSVYCPHTSFDDHTAPDGSFPRRSIETRLLAVFEHN